MAAKRSSGAKKYGRSRKKCESYRMRGVRERNKQRKLEKHAKRHPRDLQAIKALPTSSRLRAALATLERA